MEKLIHSLLVFWSIVFCVKSHALAITNVRAISNTVIPEQKSGAEVRFSVDETAEVTFEIFDASNQRVYHVAKPFPAGDHAFVWNGVSSAGRKLLPDAYFFTLKASSGDQHIEYDVTEHTGGRVVQVSNLRWDNESGKIHFSIGKPSRVLIRAGIQKGPLVATISNWAVFKKGHHAVEWDGLDAQDVINLSAHPKLRLVADAFTVPKNSLYIEPLGLSREYSNLPGTVTRRPTKASNSVERHFMAGANLAHRQDFPVSLLVSPINHSDERIEIKVDVDKKYRDLIASGRFEVAVFVDGVFFYENEIAYLPMSFYIDKQKLSPGEHLLSVNVIGFDGNMGYGLAPIIRQ
ncbi:hypothetical protein GYB62_02875 [bacterium]|nr:hypothetical protein [bacterium]